MSLAKVCAREACLVLGIEGDSKASGGFRASKLNMWKEVRDLLQIPMPVGPGRSCLPDGIREAHCYLW